MSAAPLLRNIPPLRPVAAAVSLNLPEPPSSNALFRNVSATQRAVAKQHGQKLPGRLKSGAYLTWINAAGWELQAQKPGRVEGGYELTLTVGDTRADIGNLEKAVSDLMQTHGVVSNDRRADRIVIERNSDLPSKRVSVAVRPMAGAGA